MSDPAEPRRPYHHGNLRKALLDAAEGVLREHGASRLSLRDLAREVGVSHAAPRRHFADRQSLLDALAETGFARLGESLQSAIDSAGSATFPACILAAVTAFARFATDNSALLELMQASKHRPDARAVVEASDAAFAPMIGLIRQGQAVGALAAGDPERIGMILFATIFGISTLINRGLIDPGTREELVHTAVEQFLRGASAP